MNLVPGQVPDLPTGMAVQFSLMPGHTADVCGGNVLSARRRSGWGLLCQLLPPQLVSFPFLHQLPELAQPMSIESVMPSNHLILCRPLLLLPSIFPSIRVFSSELVLPIRWPKDWSFSFSISPSNEYSGLISFKIDWFDILVVQGTLKSPELITFKWLRS